MAIFLGTFLIIIYSAHFLYGSQLDPMLLEYISIRDDINANIYKFDTVLALEDYIKNQIVDVMLASGYSADVVQSTANHYRQQVVDRKLKDWILQVAQEAYRYLRLTHDLTLNVEKQADHFKVRHKIFDHAAYEPLVKEYKTFLNTHWQYFRPQKSRKTRKGSHGTEDEEFALAIDQFEAKPLEGMLHRKEKLKHFIDDLIHLSLVEYKFAKKQQPDDQFLQKLLHEVEIELKKSLFDNQNKEELLQYANKVINKQLQQLFGAVKSKKKVKFSKNPVDNIIKFEIDPHEKIRNYIDKLFDKAPLPISSRYIREYIFPHLEDFLEKNHLPGKDYASDINAYIKIKVESLVD